jgi:hypothetical protein
MRERDLGGLERVGEEAHGAGVAAAERVGRVVEADDRVAVHSILR